MKYEGESQTDPLNLHQKKPRSKSPALLVLDFIGNEKNKKTQPEKKMFIKRSQKCCCKTSFQ